MRKLIVGGTFDENGGKPSYIVSELSKTMGWETVNGGSIEIIREFDPTGIDVLLWMPNVSNDESKIIDTLKTINPHMILIQSKRVIEKSYLPSDIIGRLLKSHSILGIMITKVQSYRYRLFDPLGNIWVDTEDVGLLGRIINKRIEFLTGLNRVGSIQTDMIEDYKVPKEFLDVVKRYGNEFAKYVNAVNPNRMLGNASTRCANGFPAIRMENHILVSRRNVDKETLNEDDFVLTTMSDSGKVAYKGDRKPSVDTPIQLKLFDYYDNVKYMIHGHVYVKGGIKTSNKLPCGYVEEFDEIVKLVPEKTKTNFVINLKGHGCLIMSDNIEFLEENLNNIYSRPFPES